MSPPSYLPKGQTAGFSEDLCLFLFFFSIRVPVRPVGAGGAGPGSGPVGRESKRVGPRLTLGSECGAQERRRHWEHRWTRSRKGGGARVQGQPCREVQAGEPGWGRRCFRPGRLEPVLGFEQPSRWRKSRSRCCSPRNSRAQPGQGPGNPGGMKCAPQRQKPAPAVSVPVNRGSASRRRAGRKPLYHHWSVPSTWRRLGPIRLYGRVRVHG